MSQCDWWAPHDGGMVFCVGDSGHRGKHTSTLGSFTEWRPRTTRVMELTAEVSRLREALENAADDGHHAMCETMRLYRGCTCHQAETLKALGLACPACDGEGAIAEAEGHGRRYCAKCDAAGRAATNGDR